jgi:hypothetical protein
MLDPFKRASTQHQNSLKWTKQWQVQAIPHYKKSPTPLPFDLPIDHILYNKK